MAVSYDKQYLPYSTSRCVAVYMSAYECFYLFDHFPSVKNHIKNLISKNEIAMSKRFPFWIEGEKRERGLRV